jgi:hypothetical protein
MYLRLREGMLEDDVNVKQACKISVKGNLSKEYFISRYRCYLMNTGRIHPLRTEEWVHEGQRRSRSCQTKLSVFSIQNWGLARLPQAPHF